MRSEAASYLPFENMHPMSIEDASGKGIDVELLAFV